MSRICHHKQRLSVYDTILFDLDGTLYNSERFYAGVFEDMALWLVQQGLQKTQDLFMDCVMGLRRAKGNDYRHVLDDALQFLAIDMNVKERLQQLYREHDCRYLVLDHHESSVLDDLKQGNKKMFIVTNGHRQVQEKKIKKLELDHYMTGVFILDPLEKIRLKPDRAAFDCLCRDGEPKKAVMVGDRFDIDGRFAQNAGIDFIGVGFHGN